MFAAKKLQGAGGTGAYGAGPHWIALLGGTGNEVFFTVATDSSGDIIAVGRTASDGAGNYDCLIAKYDTSGSLLWDRTLGGSDQDSGAGVAVDSSDNIIVAGYLQPNSSDRDTLLAKYNSSGTLQWQRTLAGGYNKSEEFTKVVIDSSDNIIAVGLTNSFAASSQGLIAKYNSSGTLQWQKTFSGTGANVLLDVVLDSSENIIVSGYTNNSTAGGSDCLIAKFNSSGTLQWQKRLGGASSDQFEGVTVDSSDNIFVVGYTASDGAGSNDLLVAKYNSSGTLQWDKTLGGSSIEYGNGVAVDSSGNIYFSGSSNSTGGAGSFDTIVGKLDSSGGLLWCNSIGGTGNDFGYRIRLDSSDNVIMTASTASDGAGGEDAMLLKLHPDGTGTGTYGSLTYQSRSFTFADAVLTDATASLTVATSTLTDSTSSLTDAAAVLTEELLEITI